MTYITKGLFHYVSGMIFKVLQHLFNQPFWAYFFLPPSVACHHNRGLPFPFHLDVTCWTTFNTRCMQPPSTSGGLSSNTILAKAIQVKYVENIFHSFMFASITLNSNREPTTSSFGGAFWQCFGDDSNGLYPPPPKPCPKGGSRKSRGWEGGGLNIMIRVWGGLRDMYIDRFTNKCQ